MWEAELHDEASSGLGSAGRAGHRDRAKGPLVRVLAEVLLRIALTQQPKGVTAGEQDR